MADDDHLRQLNINLDRAVAGGDAAKVLQACDRLLSHHPSDDYALRCKGAVLIQQGKHAIAIKCFEALLAESNNDDDTNNDVSFELALCQYKLGKYVEAKATLANCPTAAAATARVRNLKAQVHYNLEEYAEAISIYESLLAENVFRDDVEKAELVLNLTASYASCADSTKCAKSVKQHNDVVTHDTLYNLGTAYVAAKQGELALQALQQAEQWCLQENGVATDADPFDDNAAPNLKELRDEVAAIKVQQAYALYQRGEEPAAAAILERIVKFKPASSVTFAVACVNMAAIKRSTDFYDTYRRLSAVQQPAMASKLTSRQRLLVQYNTCLLLLTTGAKSQQCRKLADDMCKESPLSDLGPLAMAAVLARDKNANAAEEYLNSFLSKSTGSSNAESRPVGAQLMLAQLYVNRGDVTRAVELLRKSASTTLKVPAVWTTILAVLFTSQFTADPRPIVAELIAIAKKHFADEEKCWRILVTFSLKYKLAELEVAVERLRALSKNAALLEKLNAVGAVAIAPRDAAQAERMLGSAFGAYFKRSVALDAVESAVPRRQALDAAGYKRDVAAGTTQVELKTKKRRVRSMRKPPKKMGEGNRADPERWLPIKMRSYIKELPPRRQLEMKQRRADEQKEKRKLAAKRKAASLAAPPPSD